MTRKTRSGEPDKRHGGYRHGVPGGGAQARIAIDCTIDLKERWREASIRAGYHKTRGLVPFIIELVEAGIKARGLDKPEK